MSNSHDELDSPMDDIKQSLKLLTKLALRSGERMDALEEAQTNSERKIAALADTHRGCVNAAVRSTKQNRGMGR